MLKTRINKLMLVLIVLVVLAIAAVIVFAARGGVPEESAAQAVPTPMPTASVVVREVERVVEVEKTFTPEMMEDGLRDMGSLITEEYFFTEAMSYSSVKKFLKTDIELGFTESSYVALYDGVVSAGLDFAAVRVEKDEEARELRVHIPKAAIQSVTLDPESFRLCSEKTGLGNPISVEDFNASLVELEQNAKARALERGILEHADDNAKTLVRSFLASFVDMSEWSIVFE